MSKIVILFSRWFLISTFLVLFNICCTEVLPSSFLDSVTILFHFHGTTDSSLIGSRVKGIGDVNNDGFDDIAFNSNFPSGAYIFYGTSILLPISA